MMDMLEIQVERFSRQMGAERAPAVQVIPGFACFYSPTAHCIAIGIEVLEQASPATVKAILAHEVGHSVQPDVRRDRLRHHLLAPAFAVQGLGIVFLLCGAFWLCLASSLLGLALLVWSTPSQADSFAQHVARELDADLRGASVLGVAHMAGALQEYSRLFQGDRPPNAVAVRLRCLQRLYVRPP